MNKYFNNNIPMKIAGLLVIIVNTVVGFGMGFTEDLEPGMLIFWHTSVYGIGLSLIFAMPIILWLKDRKKKK